MEIQVKGHSGCDIAVRREGDDLFVHKSSHDLGYLDRLVLQAKKQQEASLLEYQHIRVPKILEVTRTEASAEIKMEYIYSKNFIEHFESAGFEQINYLVKALIYFLEREIKVSPMATVPVKFLTDKMADVKRKTLANKALEGDKDVIRIINKSEEIFSSMTDFSLPVGICHGDLTFSNILFNGNNYYLIDFLDSFIESPMLDIVKLRQDTAHRWSQLMYTKSYDAVRLHIVCDKIDKELHSYFYKNYAWYAENYAPLQLMNFLRIVQYAHEPKVIDYLKNTLNNLLHEF